MRRAPDPRPVVFAPEPLAPSPCRFVGLSAAIVSGLDAWKAIYDSVEPQNETLPAPWSTRLDGFQKILVLRLLRPDMVMGAGGVGTAITLVVHPAG